MTKWYDKVISSVVDGASDLLEDGTDHVKSGKCYSTVSKLKSSGAECYTLAKETARLCETTQTRGQDMIDFGSDITGTLRGCSTKMDVETLETIKDLMDGDRLRDSMELAKDMDVIALNCVDKSCRMVTIMEEVMETVPPPLQKMINRAAGKDDEASELEQERTRAILSTLDQDLEDGKACVDALQHLDIASALKIGTRAFENLSSKATLSRSMFLTMRGFSDEVASYTKAMNDNDVGDMFKLAAKVKDMWHCLKLSGFMRQLAEAAGKVMRVMIDLFKAMSERLSTLWAALAFAKDCMVDCITHITQAKTLILTAQERSKVLVECSRSIANQLDDLGELNMKSVQSIQKLSEGGELKEAIELASTMDDLVVDCTGKVFSMVGRVTEGFRNLPDIIIADVTLEEEGKKDRDPEPDDIEENIGRLERSRAAIDSGDIFTATKASIDGFQGVLDNEDHCQSRLLLVEGFATDCNSVIDSFLGVWDLESAMDKISEMCRIVRLGDLIKQFADQIKRLLQAIIALMKATLEKLSIDNLKNIDIGHAVDAVKDGFGDFKDKLKLWKR